MHRIKDNLTLLALEVRFPLCSDYSCISGAHVDQSMLTGCKLVGIPSRTRALFAWSCLQQKMAVHGRSWVEVLLETMVEALG